VQTSAQDMNAFPAFPEFDAVDRYVVDALLMRTASLWPDEEGMVHVKSGFRQSWRGLAEDVDKLARGLCALGFRKGDRIALWGITLPHWVTWFFAIERLGLVAVPINSACHPEELADFLVRSRSKAICLVDGPREEEFIEGTKRVLPGLESGAGRTVRLEQFPDLRHVLFSGMEPREGMHCFAELEELGRTVPEEAYQAMRDAVAMDDLAMVQYTSGTSGKPKGVLLHHSNLVSNAWWAGVNLNYSHEDRFCLPLPLFHCFGSILGALTFTTHGCTIVFVETFTPKRVLASLAEERCTGLYAVPSMFRLFLRTKSLESYDLSHLRKGIMAGAVCPADLIEQAIRRMNMTELANCYGQTETSPVFTQVHPADDMEKRLHSSGRVIQGVQLAIKDADGRILQPGSIGEVCARGWDVMHGYDGDPEATAKAIDKDGWLHTGDTGWVDEQGYLFVSGRIRDIIIRCGENISPKEIENCLASCPGVADAAVVGVPSVSCGEEICAFLIPDGTQVLRNETVRQHCMRHLASQKLPRFVGLLERFPMTTTGKVESKTLRMLGDAYFNRPGLETSDRIPSCTETLDFLTRAESEMN